MTLINKALVIGSVLTVVIASLVTAPRWDLQSSGVSSRLRGVSAASDRVVWASGANSAVQRTDDGGSTWQQQKVTDDRLDFRDIDAINDQIAYVMSIGNGPASRIYKTIDAGVTWTEQFRAEDARAFLDAMSFWDADHGIAIGDSIDGSFFILTTTNGGRNWSRVSGGLPPALENEGAFAASGTDIAVIGTSNAWIGTGAAAKARVLRTKDGGRSWAIAETPIASGKSSGIFSIAFRDVRHGVVVGGDYSKETNTVDNLAVTEDSGATWKLVKGLSGFRSAVAYVPGLRVPALVAVGPSGADYSVDDGRTWRILEGPGFDTLSFAPRRNIAWGAGARGILGRLSFAR